MNAGDPRSFAKPMNPRAVKHEAYGSWRGKGQVFNILNRQMGFHYTLADESTINSRLLMGFEVVNVKTHPERFVGYGRVHQRYGEVKTDEMYLAPYYLMRMPLAKWNQILRERSERLAAEMATPTTMLISQNSAQEAMLQKLSQRAGKNYVPRGGAFFKGEEHGETGFGHEEVEVVRNGQG